VSLFQVYKRGFVILCLSVSLLYKQIEFYSVTFSIISFHIFLVRVLTLDGSTTLEMMMLWQQRFSQQSFYRFCVIFYHLVHVILV